MYTVHELTTNGMYTKFPLCLYKSCNIVIGQWHKREELSPSASPYDVGEWMGASC